MRFRFFGGLVIAAYLALSCYFLRIHEEHALKLQYGINQAAKKAFEEAAGPQTFTFDGKTGYAIPNKGFVIPLGWDLQDVVIDNEKKVIRGRTADELKKSSSGYIVHSVGSVDGLPANPVKPIQTKQEAPTAEKATGDHAAKVGDFDLNGNIDPEDKEVLELVRHRGALLHTMTTQVATEAEMQEFLDLGPWIFASIGGWELGVNSFGDNNEKFLEALRVQNEIRRMVKVPACQEERKEP